MLVCCRSASVFCYYPCNYVMLTGTKEHPNVRIFTVHPRVVPTDLLPSDYHVQAVDLPELTGGMTLYPSTSRGDFLRVSFVSVSRDVEEMEKHGNEIKKKRLLNTAFLNAKLGPCGHPFDAL